MLIITTPFPLLINTLIAKPITLKKENLKTSNIYYSQNQKISFFVSVQALLRVDLCSLYGTCSYRHSLQNAVKKTFEVGNLETAL